MKKIVCELCEGTQFTKEGGFFVCHNCGTKYSLEEAKNMMREVEGEPEPFVGGSPVVTMPVVNPNQQQIDNILLLASNAYAASNNEETEKYCNRAIELDASCYKAWLLKGKAIGWSSKIDNNRVAEAAHSFKQAVDFAPDDEKDDVRNEAAEELKRLGLACISLRKQRFSQWPDDQELSGFVSDLEPLVNGLAVLLSKSNEVAQLSAVDAILGGFAKKPTIAIITVKMKAEKAGVPQDFFSQIAVMMSQAATSAFSQIKSAYNGASHPVPNDFSKTLNQADNCRQLLDMATSLSDDDTSRYDSLINIVEFTINMTAYPDYSSSYRTWMLTDEAKKNRRKWISDYREKITKLKRELEEKKQAEAKKAEEEKQARIQAYWEAHAEEKATLEAEKKQLAEKKETLDSEIGKLTDEIETLRKEEKAAVPSEEETDKLKEQIRGLEKRRANLGMFSGKEKKQITEEIASLQGRIDSLKGKIEDEKKAKAEEVKKKIEPLQGKKDELTPQRDKLAKRISAIDAEFSKDPEA